MLMYMLNIYINIEAHLYASMLMYMLNIYINIEAHPVSNRCFLKGF